jgi:hypothetical protein
MDNFEQRVQAEIARLGEPEFPMGRAARRQRTATIRALAEATMAGVAWTGENGVLGSKRDRLIVSENTFYSKPYWYANPLTREVIENVTNLYLMREAEEKERARQEKRVWLENKELEAAEKQFSKADDLLSLPHITKKTKSVDGETTIILDPANAAIFNAAVNLNLKGSDLARRSLALPTEVKRSELTGAEGGAIALRNDGLEEVSDEELQRRIAALAAGALAAVGEGYAGESVAGDEAGATGNDPAGEV